MIDAAQSTSTQHQSNSNHHHPFGSPINALHSRAPTFQANAHGALPPQDRPNPLQAYRMNASAAAMFGDREHSMREGYALREHSFIQQTETQLDSFIAQGREVWTNLTEQRDILKGTQRRLRDVGVTLGLSRDVIGYIERRSTQDNILFVFGAIFTLVCFYYIYKWFG
jgi:golgi SNAP receptor complex member 2